MIDLEFLETARFINLVLAVTLFGFALVGVVFMRDRKVFEVSGRYALWGLFFLTAGGVIGAIAPIIPGEQPLFTYTALALRVTSVLFLATHIIFNIRKARSS